MIAVLLAADTVSFVAQGDARPVCIKIEQAMRQYAEKGRKFTFDASGDNADDVARAINCLNDVVTELQHEEAVKRAVIYAEARQGGPPGVHA